jgi:TolB-like protein/Tfp pilus assembly protein PilF
MLTTGTHLGPYEILGLIGAGGMGEVYRARDTRLGRDVAIKVLPAEFAADAERLKRFEREAKATAALSHPNILDVHDVGTHEGAPYLVEELLEGESLRERLARGAVPAREALGIVVQIAHGLAVAHEKSIVHRDLKPENVFVTKDGIVKILDFGLAKLVEGVPIGEVDTLTHAPTSVTEFGRVLGTVAYMAPEQARGMAVDQRTDIFAFGVVLYEMVTGEHPFRGETATDTVAAILKEEPAPLPASAPAQLAAVLEKCLAKEPERRYQRGSELLAALEAVQSEGAVPLWPTLTRAVRRRPWLVAANVAVALAVLALALDVGGLRGRILGGAGARRINSLAVLPLANLSGDAGQDYLAAGLHEALITDLARLGGLKRVIARGSVMRFAKTEMPPRQIAKELGVDALITGSVMRSGDRVRVTAQLVDADTDAQLWGERYERNLRDVLALENDVVAAITREIRLKLTPQEHARLASARPVNPEAYEACLKGRFHWYKLSREGLDSAEKYYTLALEKDPNYAPAHEGMANVWLSRTDTGLVARSEAMPRANASALKALELDDTFAQAHVTLANLKIMEWDWATADKEFRRALELNPNSAEAHFMYADFLVTMRRTAEWESEVRRSLELDPLNFFWQAFLGWHLVYERRYDEAIAQLTKVVQAEPDFSSAHLGLWGAYFKKGADAAALAEAKKFFGILGDREVVDALDAGWSHAGYRGAMRRAGDVLVARYQRTYYPAIRVARVLAHAGDSERALEFLEKAYERQETPLYHIGVGWDWDELRSDPRFQSLLRRMSLPSP